MTARDRLPSLDRILALTAVGLLPIVLGLVLLDQWAFLSERFSRGQVVGRDAYVFWAAARLAVEGRLAEVYDHAAFQQAVMAMLGPGTGLHAFPYPPLALALIAPFGWLPYPLVLGLWSVGGVAAFVAVVAAPDFRRLPVLLALAAPLTLANVVLGQNGLLAAALMIGGLRLAPRAPVIAGVMIGLLVFKPMLGLFLPLALLLDRRWRVIVAAGGTVVLLGLVSFVLFGPDVWRDYLGDSVPFQRGLLETGSGLAQMMKLTGFMAARSLGFDIAASYRVQAVFSLLGFILVTIGLWRRRGGRGFDGRDMLIVALGTAVAVPYLHFYDLTAITAAQILMAARPGGTTPRPAGAFLHALLWTLPILGLLLNIEHLPLAAPLLLTALAVVSLLPRQAEGGHAA